MTRLYPRIDARLFAGWSDARLAAYAKKRIAHYQRPGGPFTPGEKALLIDAWRYAAKKAKERQKHSNNKKAA